MSHHITIYHNPKCSQSCNALALIRHHAGEPRIVFYLETVLAHDELAAVIAAIGKPIRDILRQKETLYQSLDLDHAKWSDRDLIDIVLLHPILLNRPIVVTPLGTRLCRPAELVLEILLPDQQ